MGLASADGGLDPRWAVIRFGPTMKPRPLQSHHSMVGRSRGTVPWTARCGFRLAQANLVPQQLPPPSGMLCHRGPILRDAGVVVGTIPIKMRIAEGVMKNNGGLMTNDAGLTNTSGQHKNSSGAMTIAGVGSSREQTMKDGEESVMRS